MSAVVLTWSIALAQIFLGLAMGCAAFRMLRGPRAQDRVLGFDTLYVNAMLLLLTFGIRSGSTSISRRRWSSPCSASSRRWRWPSFCCAAR